MTTAVLSLPVGFVMPHAKGRSAGLFWLLTFIFGTFSFVLATNPELRRWGAAADLVATICYVAATVFVYDILKAVDRTTSMLAAFFSLVGCTVSAVGLVFRLSALAANGGPAMPVLRVSTISFVFFGLHCLLVGWLILRSAFLPRVVGLLMVIAGLGWLTQSFSSLLIPGLPRPLSEFLMLPGVVGEGALSLWLLIAGVNVPRWVQQATEH